MKHLLSILGVCLLATSAFAESDSPAVAIGGLPHSTGTPALIPTRLTEGALIQPLPENQIAKTRVVLTSSVRQSTCQLTNSHINTNLGAIESNFLRVAGSTALTKSFDIILKNCPPFMPSPKGPLTQVTINFPEDQDTINPATGNLINTKDPNNQNSISAQVAKNVEIRLLNGQNGQAINLHKNTNVPTGQLNINTSDIKLPFLAQLYATGAATAGSVYSSATFEIVYK